MSGSVNTNELKNPLQGAGGYINLSGKAYPFGRTAEGANLLQQLHINFQAVKNGNREEMKRYAYCIAAGAAKAENVTFDFTIAGFIEACPHDWRERVEKLMETGDRKQETEDQKQETENDQKNKNTKIKAKKETGETQKIAANETNENETTK